MDKSLYADVNAEIRQDFQKHLHDKWAECVTSCYEMLDRYPTKKQAIARLEAEYKPIFFMCLKHALSPPDNTFEFAGETITLSLIP